MSSPSLPVRLFAVALAGSAVALTGCGAPVDGTPS